MQTISQHLFEFASIAHRLACVTSHSKYEPWSCKQAKGGGVLPQNQPQWSFLSPQRASLATRQRIKRVCVAASLLHMVACLASPDKRHCLRELSKIGETLTQSLGQLSALQQSLPNSIALAVRSRNNGTSTRHTFSYTVCCLPVSCLLSARSVLLLKSSHSTASQRDAVPLPLRKTACHHSVSPLACCCCAC
jgi:hypothetical protein